MPGALAGTRVLSMTHALAGPMCAMLLGDMGADVIMIENPAEGEDQRHRMPKIGGQSYLHLTMNRNKRSLVINLKQPQGGEILQALVKSADVFLHNYRPEAVERLGAGYERLSEINPRLVYCSITGYGTESPYTYLGGQDLIVQGLSGTMSVITEPGRRPITTGIPIMDYGTGMYAAYGIVSALMERERSGLGQHVEACLMDSAISWFLFEAASYFCENKIPDDEAACIVGFTPYGSFKTKDDEYVNIAGAGAGRFEKLLRILGADSLLEDERFATHEIRWHNYKLLNKVIQQYMLTKTKEEILAGCRKEGLLGAPVNKVIDVLNGEHAAQHQMLVEQTHPQAGKVKVLGLPVKLSRTPGQADQPAPSTGQHTREILASLGYSSDQIDALEAAKVVSSGPPSTTGS